MKKPSKNCKECGGTGRVSVYGHPFEGEPHMADIDSKPCICTLEDEEEFMDDDSDLDDITEDMAMDAAMESGLSEDEAGRMIGDILT